MKEALKVFENLPNNYAQTNIAFSPDEQLFLTGTSFERESKTGGVLCFYNRAKLELVSRVGISLTSSVVQCAWHPKLNQVTPNDICCFILIVNIGGVLDAPRYDICCFILIVTIRWSWMHQDIASMFIYLFILVQMRDTLVFLNLGAFVSCKIFYKWYSG